MVETTVPSGFKRHIQGGIKKIKTMETTIK
jgi:hypothetical protein